MKPRKPRQPVPEGGEILLYQTEDGQTRIDCRFEEGTIWLTQAQIAEAATCEDYLQVRQEGTREVSRNLCHYRLTQELGKGFKQTNLKHFRQFYLAFPAQTATGNGHTLCDQLHQSICA
jgi:hypothetical protein